MSTLHSSIERREPDGVAVPPEYPMTEEEFIAWCDEDTRAEWVDGEVVMMAPVSDEHSDLDGWLLSLLRLFAEHHNLGLVRGPEFPVRLGSQRRRRVPDLLFVSQARREILRRHHVEGAPDLVVEIVSPESLARDWREKYLEYEKAGVKEYWVIDPMAQHVELYVHSGPGGYKRVPEKDGTLTSSVLPGLRIRTEWLWPATRLLVLQALKELGVTA